MASGGAGRFAAATEWRNWSLTTKLAAVVLVPVIFAITLGVGQIRWQVGQADEYDRVGKVVDAVDRIEPLILSAQEERTNAVEFLTGSAGPEVLDRQAAVVDSAAQATHEVMADRDAYSEVVQERYAELRTQLDQLAGLRAQVRAKQLPPPAAIDGYSRLVTAVLSLDLALTSTVADRNLSSTSAAMQDMVVLMEEVRLQQAWVLTGLVDGEIRQPAVDALLGSRARLLNKITEARATVATHWQQRLDQTLSAPAIRDRNMMLQAILVESTDDKASGSYSVSHDQWNSRTDEVITLIDDGHDDLAAEIRGIAFKLEDDASNAAGWDSVLLLSALILAAAVIITFARQLLGSLRELRRGALDSAHRGLPEVVSGIRQGRQVADELPPVRVDTEEEVGQVARAFDEVNRQAIRLAVEQASLRRGYSEAFVSVSRRSQSLLERQLRLFEELEKDEEDPDQLARLFQLDHLATRMRRNNENLMVLSGSDLARRFYQPTDLADVLRAAVSEIEQYPRVVVQPPPAVKLVGHAASDLVRLVAELLDNAANFSSPDTSVTVSSYQPGDGSVVLDVLDEGIGMGDRDLAAANERLARVDEDDLATSRRMGLFVVGRLAVRHGIRVELHGGPDVEGVRATAVIPAEHVASAETPKTPPPPALGGQRNGSSHHDVPNAVPIPEQSAGEHSGPIDSGSALPRRESTGGYEIGSLPKREPAAGLGSGDALPRREPALGSEDALPKREPAAGLGSGDELPRREPAAGLGSGDELPKREPAAGLGSGGELPKRTARQSFDSGPQPAMSDAAALFEPSSPDPQSLSEPHSFSEPQSLSEPQPFTPDPQPFPEQPAEQTANLFSPVLGESALDIPQQPRTVSPDFPPAWPERPEPETAAEPSVFEDVSTQWFQPADPEALAQTGQHDFAWPDPEADPLGGGTPGDAGTEEPDDAGLPGSSGYAELAGEAGMSEEPAPLTASGLPQRTPRDSAARSATDVSREFSERYNGVRFGQSEPDDAQEEPDTSGQDAWNFAADDARRAAEAAASSQPTSFTEAGLPRRTPKAQLAPGSIAAGPEDDGGGLFERNADELRSRLADFQSGARRGRHRAPDEG
ncbi:sensor histidine kinase [Saccharopolyspora taberi]|uniref:histidine kinase n=1 Tax=Saccharopolyspora taberi TaxID=60895 RepID=A0ABN3V9E8_9PSEU